MQTATPGAVLPEESKVRLVTLLETFITEPSELEAVLKGDPLAEAVSIDSLTMLHMVTEIEKAFDVRFEIDTVGEVFHDLASLESFLSTRGASPP